MVTPDDNGLFASVASAPEGGGGSGGGGVGGTGGGGNTGGAPPAVQNIVGGDSCANQFAINLGYGAGKNAFRGTGDTKGDQSPTEESACQENADGPDRVHAITVDAPEGGYLTARLVRGDGKTAFDSILYLRNFCEGGAGTVCEDAFVLNRNKQREPANGGEIVSVFLSPSSTPITYFLYVDGVGANSGGRYELEVSLNKGDCLDPIPIFVEPGSPVRAQVSRKLALPIMQHKCGNSGSLDVVLKVSRAQAGPMLVSVDLPDSDLAVAFLEGICDNKAPPDEGRCASNSLGGASLGEASWPGGQQSIYVVVDTGDATAGDRVIPLTFDPSGGIDTIPLATRGPGGAEGVAFAAPGAARLPRQIFPPW